MSSLLLAAALLVPALRAQAPSPAQTEVTAPTDTEAAALAFPGCTMRRETVAVTPEQQRLAKEAAKVATVPNSVVRHVASRDGKVVGYAYVDRRCVRTHPQTLLVVVDADGKVSRVEVLAFEEPRRYRPRAAFFAQFAGSGLTDELQPRRAIQPIAGATLSVRATVDGVRTVLAVHAQLGTK